MSIRGCSMLGAVALCLGLLMVVGGSSYKSTAIIKYERDLAKPKPNAEPPAPPTLTVPNVIMVLGWIAATAGAVLLPLALRGMMRQIGDLQSSIDSQMRMEIAVKRDSKSKP